jgi:hypothetical protein
MRVNRGLLGWGVFFIVLGAVPLAVRAGVIDPARLVNAWQLWPLILVGIGLGLVLSRTRAAILGGLVVAVTFGLIGGAALATGLAWNGFGLASCGVGVADRGPAFPASSGTLTGSAPVRLEMDCGEVTASPADGAGWTLEGTSDDGVAPEVAAAAGALTVRAPERAARLGATGSTWRLSLPREASIALDLAVNAGSGDLDLAGMTVTRIDTSVNAGSARVDASGAGGTRTLDASVNAGSATILLPVPEGTLRGSVSVNLGSAEVCVPDGVAVRIHGGATLGSIDGGRLGLVETGDGWVSPAYDGAASRVELDVSANLGSISIGPEGDCD